MVAYVRSLRWLIKTPNNITKVTWYLILGHRLEILSHIETGTPKPPPPYLQYLDLTTKLIRVDIAKQSYKLFHLTHGQIYCQGISLTSKLQSFKKFKTK